MLLQTVFVVQASVVGESSFKTKKRDRGDNFIQKHTHDFFCHFPGSHWLSDDAEMSPRKPAGIQKLPNVLPHTKHVTRTHTTVLWPFFQGDPGQPVPEENFWTLWCKGRLMEADTPTIWMGDTPSGLTSAHLQHPILHPSLVCRLDALPVAQPTASKHWRQACYCAKSHSSD